MIHFTRPSNDFKFAKDTIVSNGKINRQPFTEQVENYGFIPDNQEPNRIPLRQEMNQIGYLSSGYTNYIENSLPGASKVMNKLIITMPDALSIRIQFDALSLRRYSSSFYEEREPVFLNYNTTIQLIENSKESWVIPTFPNLSGSISSSFASSDASQNFFIYAVGAKTSADKYYVNKPFSNLTPLRYLVTQSNIVSIRDYCNTSYGLNGDYDRLYIRKIGEFYIKRVATSPDRYEIVPVLGINNNYTFVSPFEKEILIPNITGSIGVNITDFYLPKKGIVDLTMSEFFQIINSSATTNVILFTYKIQGNATFETLLYNREETTGIWRTQLNFKNCLLDNTVDAEALTFDYVFTGGSITSANWKMKPASYQYDPDLKE